MKFEEAIEILGINSHQEAILKAHPKGNLNHLKEYIDLAKNYKKHNIDASHFAIVFNDLADFFIKDQGSASGLYLHLNMNIKTLINLYKKNK